MTIPPAFAVMETAILSLETHLQQREPRALDVARLLFDACPDALLGACSLDDHERQVVAVDATGQPLPEVQELLDGCRSSIPPSNWNDPLAKWGTPFVASAEHVLLAVVFDPSVSVEAARVRLTLSCMARSVALATLRRQTRALAEKVEALEPMANVGELAGVVAHEMTNFLNMLLLQVSVLESRGPRSEREDLAIIRRRGNQASDLIHRFQEYRRTPGAPAPRVDLAEVVRNITDHLGKESPDYLQVLVADKHDPSSGTPSGGITLSRECSASDPWVRGRSADVSRLVCFLVANAVRAAAQSGRRVVVAVDAGASGPTLRVDSSASLPCPADLATVFDGSAPARGGMEKLELSACRSLARRLRCGLRAESGPEGGIRFVAEFPRATAG